MKIPEQNNNNYENYLHRLRALQTLYQQVLNAK